MGKPVLCVLCRARPMNEQWRPFCGERCRNEDLARWADGRYHVAGDSSLPDSVDSDVELD